MTWTRRAGLGPVLWGQRTGGHGEGRRGSGVRGCPGLAHPQSVPTCLPPHRIVCTIEAAEAPLTGGVEVDINGKLGHSPPHAQFTYQVSTSQVSTDVGRVWGPPDGGCGPGEARAGRRACVPTQP